MYGKYVKGHNPIFGHLHGSTWHGEDAKSVLWFVKHPIFLLGLGLATACGTGLWALAVHRLRTRHGGSGAAPGRCAPLVEVMTLKSS